MPSFERDIKPLFRASDRMTMEFVFDLWSYDDVRANAAAILDRVSDGTMPCDAEWSEDLITRFAGWIDGGFER